ncbi:MAG: septum formation initiator family protein [Candidatus Moranbacteria bacterium]|nr:septum formation initiator family protein [Candidatus Moranbacteria bacterium]
MKKKFSFGIIFFIAGIGLAIFISTSAVKEAYRSKKIENEVIELKKEAERIQNENENLKTQISYLQTPDFQEKVAKEKLNMQKADENVVVVKLGAEKQAPAVTDNVADDNADQQLPNYIKWWNSFFKYD